MTKAKLAKLWKKLNSLRTRKGNITDKEMVQFAESCGRYRRPGGTHPTYLSDLPGRKPLNIPSHGGKSIPVGTAGAILDELEADLWIIQEELDNQS
ncbi:MAG: hypothetical protein ACYDBJ_27255 [Aggregatilineales bacterium]